MLTRLIALAPLLLSLALTSAAQASPKAAQQGVMRSGLAIWHRLARQPKAVRGPGLRALWRGQVYQQHPKLLQRPVQLTKKQHVDNTDATFNGTHPMFQRLVKSGWYGNEAQIGKLQGLARGLTSNRQIPLSTPLDQVELLSFDLEATSGRSGKVDKQGRFRSGPDEITQFGYTVHKGGKIIDRGSILIRPDSPIPSAITQLTGLDAKKLAKAPRFEQVAGQLLKLMQGRILVGQSAIKKDWSWLQSNFARLGVDLPRPRRMILDTYLLSYNRFPQGSGVAKMSEHYGVKASGHLHDAMTDAELTGKILYKQLAEGGARTLGDAFRLQHQGWVAQHPAKAKAVQPAGPPVVN